MKLDPFTRLKRSARRKRRPGKRRGPWRSRVYREWISRHASVVSFDMEATAFEYYSYWYERNGPKEGLPVPEPESTIEW